MLSYQKLLTQMLSHFGKWTAIRRKPASTTGGKLIIATAEETMKINESIQDYIDYHFLPYHKDNVYTISYEAMQVNIGQCDLSHLQITYPQVTVTTDYNSYETSDTLAYYEAPYLYFKPTQVATSERISYIYNDMPYYNYPTRIMLWNIFDEFATYVGIKRFEFESNQDLLTRILFQASHPVNSTNTGLKNTILGVVSPYLKGADPEDIRFESPNAFNIYNIDTEGREVFQILAEINRDVYGFKIWDRDYWVNQPDSLYYIPHTYDKEPSVIQDGVGDYDDLKVVHTHHFNDMVINVETFEKEEELITKYVEKNPKEEVISLELYKYENQIKPVDAKVKITATPIYELNPSSFQMTYKKIDYVAENFPAYSFIEDKKDFSVEPSYLFDKSKHYKLRFKLTKDIQNVKLKAYLSTGENLLSEKDGFKFNADHYLTHPSIKHYVDQLYYFDSHEHFTLKQDHFTLLPYERSGSLTLHLNHLKNTPLHYFLKTTNKVPLPQSFILKQNFKETDQGYESERFEDAKLILDFKGNSLRFKVDGEAIVHIVTSHYTDSFTIKDRYFATPYFIEKAEDMRVLITPLNHENKIRVSDFEYDHFNFEIKLDKGSLIEQEAGYLIPDIEDNTMRIFLETFTGSSPEITPFYFGDFLAASYYETGSFQITSALVYPVMEKSDLEVDLICIETNETVTNYNPCPILTASQMLTVPLDLTSFYEIDTIISSVGQIVRHEQGYALILNSKDRIQDFYISGLMKQIETSISLSTLVPNYDKIFLTGMQEGLIIQNKEAITLEKIPLPYPHGIYELTPHPDYDCFFVLNNGTFYSGWYCEYPCTCFYFKLKENTQYVAYNQYQMFQEEIENIPIQKTFYPFLPYENLLYFVEPASSGTEVCFYQKSSLFDANRIYSFELTSLHYRIDLNIHKELASFYSQIELKCMLNRSIPLEDRINTVDNKIIDLAEYVIQPQIGYSIEYHSIPIHEMSIFPEYVASENFIIEIDGFKKLKYCRITDIFYIGTIPYSENASSNISQFELNSKTGVILWDKTWLKTHIGQQIYIIYLHERPKAIRVSFDQLYDIYHDSKEAFKLTSTFNLVVPKAQTFYDLSTNDYYLKADKVIATSNHPGYRIESIQKGLEIVPLNPFPEIAIHKGYYYKDNKEYFLFGNQHISTANHNSLIKAEHTKKVNNNLYLYPESSNYVLNSQFELGSQYNLIYYNHFATNPEIKSLNLLGRLNACEQLNYWYVYDGTISLEDTPYTKGIAFDLNPLGKAVYHLSKLEEKTYTFSFYLTGECEAFLIEKKSEELETPAYYTPITKKLPIDCKDNIALLSFVADPDCFYSLMLTGNGVIDDLVLTDSPHDLTIHTKNINLIYLPKQLSYKPSGTMRYLFYPQERYSGTAEMDHDYFLSPRTSMSWRITTFLKLRQDEPLVFPNAYYEDGAYHVDKQTTIQLPIIEIQDYEYLSAFYVHLNSFDDENLIYHIATGNTPDSLTNIAINQTGITKLDGKQLKRYVRISIDLAPDQMLYEAYVGGSYHEDQSLKVNYPQTLYFISEWFDLGELSHHILSFLHFDTYSNQVVSIRSSKDTNIKSNYMPLDLKSSGHLNTSFDLGLCRYVQFHIELKTTKDQCRLDYFDIDKIE